MGRRSGETFEKRAREKARLERKAAKREKREAAREESAEGGPDEGELMERFRILSQRHADGELDEASYETQRREIFDALGLDG